MSTLSQAVQDYLEMRRALGYKLAEHGRVLPQFVAFLEQRDAPLITTALALEFATQPTHASVVWRHTRLAIVRGFAIYLKAFDARHEVPPANLLPATYRRAIPYLYSDAEIDALMHAARAKDEVGNYTERSAPFSSQHLRKSRWIRPTSGASTSPDVCDPYTRTTPESTGLVASPLDDEEQLRTVHGTRQALPVRSDKAADNVRRPSRRLQGWRDRVKHSRVA
jgi:hypothetical protein